MVAKAARVRYLRVPRVFPVSFTSNAEVVAVPEWALPRRDWLILSHAP
jgi:hypothetical protein